MKKAVVLFSGGLDSATTLAIAQSQDFACYALSFNYNQRHKIEVEIAKRYLQHVGVVDHKIVDLDISQFGGSALTDQNIAVPEYNGSSEIPATYVPARNTIFLAIALGYAEAIGATDIFTGVSQIDYSHYPDCRKEFIQAFENLANVATKIGTEGQHIKIHAPLINLSKAETISAGLKLGVDYSKTVSCYNADQNGAACGKCDSCTFRKKGFNEAGVADLTHYC